MFKSKNRLKHPAPSKKYTYRLVLADVQIDIGSVDIAEQRCLWLLVPQQQNDHRDADADSEADVDVEADHGDERGEPDDCVSAGRAPHLLQVRELHEHALERDDDDGAQDALPGEGEG